MLQNEKQSSQPKRCCHNNYTCTSNLVKTNYNTLLKNLIISTPSKAKVETPPSPSKTENPTEETISHEQLTKPVPPILDKPDTAKTPTHIPQTNNTSSIDNKLLFSHHQPPQILFEPSVCVHQFESTCSIKKRTRTPFSKEEDDKLKELVNYYSNIEDNSKWYFIAGQIPGRTARQCRERFQLFLSDGIRRKEKWSKEEDEVLLQQYQILGPHWKAMEKFFIGRTSYSIKNRYISLNRHRKHFNSDSPPYDDE